MEYNYNTIPPKKKKNGLTIFSLCIAALALLCSVAISVTAYDNAEKTYEERISQIDEEYSQQLQEMSDLIKQLEAKTSALSSSSSQSLTSTSYADASVYTSISAVAAKVKPSIVNISVTVPSTQYQNGFFTYSASLSTS